MTIQEVINGYRDIRNNDTDAQTLINRINIAEDEVFAYSVNGNTEPRRTRYTTEDLDTELIMPQPYSEAYVWYCAYRQDIKENQIGSANNSIARYNELISAYKSYLQRTTKPEERARIHLEGYNV